MCIDTVSLPKVSRYIDIHIVASLTLVIIINGSRKALHTYLHTNGCKTLMVTSITYYFALNVGGSFVNSMQISTNLSITYYFALNVGGSFVNSMQISTNL